jgi:membrane protease YdiL (CAAX protease family)
MERINENDESQWRMMEAFLDSGSIMGLLFNLFMIALVPAIGEELLFRGVLQRVLGEWFRNHHIAIWVVALLFSLAHYQFSAFIPRILLGALFGYLFVWTRSIWIPVLAHFINNSMGVIYYHFYYKGGLTFNPDNVGVEGNVLIFLLSSMVVSAIILAMIRRLGNKSADAQFPGFE